MQLGRYVLLGVILNSIGCATIVRGGSEEISITTDPSGAEARLSNGMVCITPCDLEVKRKGDLTVTLRKQGYEEMETTLVSSIDGKSVGLGTAVNFLFFPIVNDIVDYNTRANFSHKPNPLVLELIPIKP